MSLVSDCAEGSSGHCTNQSDESESFVHFNLVMHLIPNVDELLFKLL